MMEWCTTGRNSIKVFYDSDLDGGGTWFGQDYIDVIKNRYPNRCFQKCLEWCAGPGFIGYNLLDHDICLSLCLSDAYEPAITSCLKTAMHLPEKYRSTVSAYVADRIALIPEHEKFDLVVANPPHFLTCPGDDIIQRIKVDQDWQAHREFFQSIGRYLTPDGVILLQENQAGSIQGVEEFRSMIESNHLRITGVWPSQVFFEKDGHTQIYYIEIKHTNDLA